MSRPFSTWTLLPKTSRNLLIQVHEINVRLVSHSAMSDNTGSFTATGSSISPGASASCCSHLNHFRPDLVLPMITDTVGNNNRLIYFQARPGWLISDPRLVLVNVFADQDYYTSHTRRRDCYVNAVLMRPLFLAPSGAQGVTISQCVSVCQHKFVYST